MHNAIIFMSNLSYNGEIYAVISTGVFSSLRLCRAYYSRISAGKLILNTVYSLHYIVLQIFLSKIIDL